MKISLEWLRDFLPDVPDERVAADALTMGGYPVEDVHAAPTGEAVLDVEVTSNRPDLLCHVGVARELAALLDLPFRYTPGGPRRPAGRVGGFDVRSDDPGLCPHYTARVVHGVKLGPSPDWIRRRLEAVGLRSINNVVDITNYVLFETGQPLHAFDLAKLRGHGIVVRVSGEGETIKTLDGHERILTPGMLCICDARGPVAVAGVMGGADTEVTAATTDILLESARFDPLSIRKTSRALKLASDSSYRYERGLDPTLVDRAGERAVALLAELAGGAPDDAVAGAGGEGDTARTVTLRHAAVARLLGVELPRDQVTSALTRLGFGVAAGDADGTLAVAVPPHRLDVTQEVDLIEEVVRVVGYDVVPERDEIRIRLVPPQPRLATLAGLRNLLVGVGFFEAVTMSFVADGLRESFLPAGASLRRVDPGVRRADGHLRPAILPGLLESVAHNQSVRVGDVRLFETGSVFRRDAGGSDVERKHLALVTAGDVAALRGVLETLLTFLDAGRPLTVEPADRPGFAPGASGRLSWGGTVVGDFGLIDRAVAARAGLHDRPAAAELDLDALLANPAPARPVQPLPRFPEARRDLSLVVDGDLPYARLQRLVDDLALQSLVTLEHAGTYRGKPLPPGRKSVTLTFVFRRDDDTVSREDADREVARVADAAARELGAVVRT